MSVPAFSLVMPGLERGIHAFPARCFQDVDCRATCGRDDGVIQEGAR
ncbi:hypothetical protein [Microvirga sp. M2]